MPKVVNGTKTEAGTSGIPIIDFTKWKKRSSLEERQAIARQVADACREVGFVYVVNHGLSPELLEEAFGWTKKLFDLNLEQKMQAPHPDGSAVHRGYSWPGLEKVSNVMSEKEDDAELAQSLRQVTDCKESYEIGSEQHKDQPNIWLPEDTLPGFRAFMTKFYWECFEIAGNILRAIALGIGLEDEDHLLRLHSGHGNQLRLLHYPPIPAAALESESSARMPAHSDWSSMTMLFQDDCGGLEVEDPHKPGYFMPATPVKDALVMNVGDLLQRWSNDYLRSTSHRVTLPPLQDRFIGSQRLTRARYSIPYFLAPDPGSLIECLPACTDEKHPVKYAPITQGDYGRMRARLQYPDQASKVAAASA